MEDHVYHCIDWKLGGSYHENTATFPQRQKGIVFNWSRPTPKDTSNKAKSVSMNLMSEYGLK